MHLAQINSAGATVNLTNVILCRCNQYLHSYEEHRVGIVIAGRQLRNVSLKLSALIFSTPRST